MELSRFGLKMKFYHGTTEQRWKEIQMEGILWGKRNSRSCSYRYTYLSPNIKVAQKYGGDVILEVEYNPIGVEKIIGIDNFGFNPPKGQYCWQFSVFVPINISKIRRLKEEEIESTAKKWSLSKCNKKARKYAKAKRIDLQSQEA